jgi:hypothetical protein
VSFIATASSGAESNISITRLVSKMWGDVLMEYMSNMWGDVLLEYMSGLCFHLCQLPIGVQTNIHLNCI